MRIFALSDAHIDYQANFVELETISPVDYQRDALILAGDLTDNCERLRAALTSVRAKFAHVFFVPGNHELWVRRQEYAHSLDKFWRIVELCESLDVRARPQRVGTSGGERGVSIVPLFSWYVQPEEGADSLFVPKPGENPTLEMWSDKYFVRWPQNDGPMAHLFLRLNEAHLDHANDAPIISFSHFLPRRDLIFPTAAERQRGEVDPPDRSPRFNFSRVAGCRSLDAQIRRLGSAVHVYGHQHRNRRRVVDGVLYVAHCLGYPGELERDPARLLAPVWDTDNGTPAGSGVRAANAPPSSPGDAPGDDQRSDVRRGR